MTVLLASAHDLLGEARGGAWLTRRRVLAYAALLLCVEVIGFAFFLAGTHGWIVPLQTPLSTDFVSFYAAGWLADSGTPWLVYQQAAHHAAEQAATQPGIVYNYFYYPPIFILLCAAIARLPYLTAFVVFQASTLVPCLLVARRILQETGWAILLPLLAFPAVFFNIGAGQNAFLTAALFGAATLLIDRRPVLAGMLFGALCYKPHFGLLVPIALVAAGRWRAVAAAAATVLALVALSVLAFGWETWRAFFAAAAGAHEIYQSHVSRAGLATPFGSVLVLGGTPALAYTVQAFATGAMMAVVWWVWRRGLSLPARAAALLAATPIALPVVLFYDLILSGMALVWLLRWGQEHTLPASSRTAVLALVAATLLSGNFNPDQHWLITPLVALGTLVLSLLVVFRESAASAHSSAATDQRA
jgi:alpha-1,2-mannosyltransferase